MIFTSLKYKSLDVKVGEETSLRCEGDGSPEPQFEWQQKLEDGDTSMVPLGKEGPVYSVEWAPNVKPVLFAVVYGYMPAKATLYNKKCESVFEYGTGPR